MRRLIFTCFLLIGLSGLTLQAQNKTFPKGLRKLTTEELKKMGSNRPTDLPAYGPDFKLLSREKMIDMMTSGE